MANLEKEERQDLNEEDPHAVYDWAIEIKENTGLQCNSVIN